MVSFGVVKPLRIEKRNTGLHGSYRFTTSFTCCLLREECRSRLNPDTLCVPSTSDELQHWKDDCYCSALSNIANDGSLGSREPAESGRLSHGPPNDSALGSPKVRVCIHGHLHFSRVRCSDPGSRTPTLSGRRSHAQIPVGSRIDELVRVEELLRDRPRAIYLRRASLPSLRAARHTPLAAQHGSLMLPLPSTEDPTPLSDDVASPGPLAPIVPTMECHTVGYPGGAEVPGIPIPGPPDHTHKVLLHTSDVLESHPRVTLAHGRSSSAHSRPSRLRLKSFSDLPLPRKRPSTADALNTKTTVYDTPMYALDRPANVVKIKVLVLASNDLFAFRLPTAFASLRDIRRALFIRNAVEYHKLGTLKFRISSASAERHAAKWSDEDLAEVPADGILEDDGILRSNLKAALARGTSLRLEAFSTLP